MDDRGEERGRPSYWAVLPATVRYDTKLPSSAKLLYAEISTLTESYGYCWASNDYFERLYGITDRTVIRLLQALEKGGYIRIENAGTTKRRIFAGLNPLAAQGDTSSGLRPPSPQGEGINCSDKNVSGGDKNVSGTDKNVIAIYNRKKEQKKGTNPPEAPQGAREPKSAPAWKPERFEAFWRYYPAIPDGNGHGRRPAKDRAARAWDKLRPDDEEIAVMGACLKAQKESRQWRDGVGIPYASTWLNSRAWRDEVETLPKNSGPILPAPTGEEAVEWV